eukprot:CAMPEP_0194211306 /NCGR_PEP_ID=MMETSP0156-20130528/9992_1 /TAXON_ID=33649 /ORGANISM="Thalassionema nitzschioides, Strain L26-B" /LENGTH=466 /DNA_ID=CAMNT_0038938817 /DNA_START=11 /DNA_END=1412 /DNA_ORIENTATION=-
MASTAPTAATAAAASLVIPFHCVICFDEFDLQEHVPMVLPCGHTYVCELCTKRLDKCMECRKPLFLYASATTSAPVTPARVATSRTSVRYNRSRNTSYHSPPRKQQPKVAPTPLPISKNAVMITIMEAARDQMVDPDVVIDADQIDNESNKILDGIEALTGPCGTYVVKDDDGLVVLPSDPRRRNRGSNPVPQSVSEPFHLEKGQTVQIVECDDGVYKLARNSGFIVAGCSQLVKVNGPLESSCRLEGMYDLVEARRKELRERLEQIERLSSGLAQRVESVKLEEPSHPIISDAPKENVFKGNSHDSDNDSKSSFVYSSPAGVGSPLQESQEPVIENLPETSRRLELLDTNINLTPNMNLAPTTPNTIDNSDIREYADENTFPGGPPGPYMCATFEFFGEDDETDQSWTNNPSFEEISKIRPRSSSSNFQTAAPFPQDHAVAGSINFSTGMSGHGAQQAEEAQEEN